MSITIAPIPTGTSITDQVGKILEFFRFRWEEVRSLATFVATVAGQPALAWTGQTAALTAQTLYTTTGAGMFAASFTLIRTVDDTVSSSIAVTILWTYLGVAKTHTFDALTELVVGVSTQGIDFPLYADANTPIQISTSYASNTPAKATYDLRAVVVAYA